MENVIRIIDACAWDAPEIARLLRTVFTESLPYLPNLHTPEEDLEFIRDNVLKNCRIIIAKDNDTIVGFCAFREGWIDHLYILPLYHGQGIGTKLLTIAKESYTEFQLWTFQKNTQARKFYEARGFIPVETTTGEGNEEKEPDVRYQWRANKL